MYRENILTKYPIVTCLLIIVVGCCLWATFSYNRTNQYEQVIVNDFITKQDIHSTNGNTTTEYRYLVVTNKGVFEISTEGLYSAQHCFGMIKVGDTLNITTRGYKDDFWGFYEHIVDAQKCN